MIRAFAAAAVFVVSLSLPFVARAQAADRAQVAQEIESLREQIRSREKRLLAPAREDEVAFAEFLRQPETGLVRLLPREQWEHKLSIRGGGAYYSFTRRTHEYGYGSDIELQQGHLSSGFAGLDYGLLVDLDDVLLEKISLETPAVRVLGERVPPSAEAEIRAQQMRAGAGETVEGLTYKSHLPTKVNHTYVLRSVQYHGEKGAGRDAIVALRVVRRDTDGSVTLLWKMLKQYPSPQYVRAEPGQ